MTIKIMSIIVTSMISVAIAVAPVTITPANVDSVEGVSVTQPNPGNSVVSNKWVEDSPLDAWGTQLTLDPKEYAFAPDSVSSVTISVDDISCSGDCDEFYSFSIGDTEFMSFLHDRDGGVWAASGGAGGTGGAFAYPRCNVGNSLAKGDPILLLDGASTSAWNVLREALTQYNGWNFLTGDRVSKEKPLIFKFTNDPINDVFTLDFSTGGPFIPISCSYKAASSCKSLKFYSSPDAGEGARTIPSFTISSTNTGLSTSCPSCINAGLDLDHACSCRAECGVDYCNPIAFVAGRLSESVSEQGLCEDGEVCCCSCPNCRNTIPV